MAGCSLAWCRCSCAGASKKCVIQGHPPNREMLKYQARLLLLGNSLGSRAAPQPWSCLLLSSATHRSRGCLNMEKRVLQRAKGEMCWGASGGIARQQGSMCLWPCAKEHTAEGKEELWISRSIVSRCRPEKLHLATQTSYVLYIWQLCLQVSGTDEAYCAWHCTYIYFKTVLATKSLELTQNGIFNKSTIIAATKMKTKL